MMAFATFAIDKTPRHRAVTDSYEYDAFGNQITHTGSTPNNYLYRGEQWDPDLGLYYLRARYYNPLSGRFMSRDPNGGNGGDPKSLHKYLYAEADPVDRIDPRGREASEEYHVTMICGGSLYCGVSFTHFVVWSLIAAQLAEVFDWSTNPAAPPPNPHTPEDPEPTNAPSQGPPVSGPPPPPPPEPPAY